MEAQNTASCGILTAIFYKKPKYLINGESNKKSVKNKSDGKFNFLYGMCCQIWCIYNQYRFIAIPLKNVKNS